MNKKLLAQNLRRVPDYPKKGVVFFDVTTLFKEPECFREVVDGMYELYKDKGITKVAGIESRGFIAGAALAARLGAGFVAMRKPGKLPAETISESYFKEYGSDTLEVHTGSITPEDVVLVHDDILATGGTAAALIIAGVMMMHNIKAIHWENLAKAIPAFVTIMTMPLAYSISDGILLGVIFYVLTHAIVGKFKSISPVMWVLAVIFILRYIFI